MKPHPLPPLMVAVLLMAGCTAPGPTVHATAPTAGLCDSSLASALSASPEARLILARSFKAGEPVALENSPAGAPAAPVDMCLVKLVVGPGYPGPPGAPYASHGIGVEVMLPAAAQWNGIIRAFGNGGWAGGAHADPTRLARTGAVDAAQLAAVGKGYVVSASDNGHGGSLAIGTNRDASFTLREDGSPNTALWKDFSERSLHEQAVQTKAVARGFYGRAPQRAYWDGFSTGGRQGYKLAQRYPQDFDGILAGAPAFNWTRFITSELYPQVVMQRELGRPIAPAKLDAASAAANAACGGAELGFQIDPRACRYDPARDAALLCEGATGTGGVQGSRRDAATCLSTAEAQALNKIWHGPTLDGSHTDPQTAPPTGPGTGPRQDGRHLWWGLMRGSTLGALAGAVPFPIASVQVALQLGKLDVAQADRAYVTNPVARAQDGWKQLGYADLAQAYERGLQMQALLADINTDNPDLSGARDAGVKVLSYHGWADELITGMGSVDYFDRAAQKMGGVDALQRFNRLFMVPGLAHDSSFSRGGAIDPATGRAISPDKLPLPQGATGRDELFNALRQWVEKGVAPERIEVASRNGAVTLPLCSHPLKATYTGSGPATAAGSYACR